MKLIIFAMMVLSVLLTAPIRATEITIEAESAVLAGPMQVSPDGQAFDNLCINGYNVNRRGWATLTVNIPKEGDYVIWGRINGRDGYTNSFFVSVDHAEPIIWDVTKSNRWEWDRVSERGLGTTVEPSVDPLVFHFKAGEHTIVIGNRERETRLDRLIITDDVEKRYYDEPTRWIKLDSPQMGDVLEPGTVVEFKWRSRFTWDKVNIDLSFDWGANFNIPVIHGTENDGSFEWTVPPWFNRAKIVARISDASGLPYDTNRGYFSSVDPKTVSLELKNPIGGEQLTPGDLYTIRWKEFAFNGLVTISLSLDNGATWTTIAENQNAGGENWWWVPNTPSTTCLIKVADSKDGEPSDVSPATFTIGSSFASNDGAMSQFGSVSDAVPDEFTLNAAYPNPFNPQTTLTFGVAESQHVTLKIYDMLGRQVATLVDGEKAPGWYQEVWNSAELPSGIYTAIFQAGSQRFTQRLTLMK